MKQKEQERKISVNSIKTNRTKWLEFFFLIIILIIVIFLFTKKKQTSRKKFKRKSHNIRILLHANYLKNQKTTTP